MGGSEAEVTVTVHMTKEMAERIATQETRRIGALNAGRRDIEAESVGTAVLNVLGVYAMSGRV